MAQDMLTIYLHYEDGNQEAKILQRSMMRRHVTYYDLMVMIEEVGFNGIDYLYYEKKYPQGNTYLVHIDHEGHVMKMLSDLEILKTVHMHVFKEKASNDIAPPNNQNDIAPSNQLDESVLLEDIAVSTERAKQLNMTRPQRQLRRSKRLNVIQVTDQPDDEEGDCNSEQYIAPVDEESLDDEGDQVHNLVQTEVGKRKRTSLPIVWNMPKGQRIVVKCNEDNQPIGDEGAILGKFLGTIARNGGFCPLNINDWRAVKKNSGEETILQCVQSKFVYPRSCEKWILKSTGRDWRKFKCSLKKAIFETAIKKNPNIKRRALYKLCPEDVDNDQWRGLIKFWKSKKGRAVSEKNVISRSLVKNSHNAGTKSYARWGEDIRQADPEKKRPHRAKVFLATHKKKDNATHKDRNELLARLEGLISEQPELAQNVNGRVAWEGDALLQVLGTEKTGQVHGMGLLATPKQAYGRTPRYLKNINVTSSDGSPREGEADVWEEIAKLKEHIRRQDQIIQDSNKKDKESYEDIGIEHEENLQSNDNGNSRLSVLHGNRKRVQCNGPAEEQHDTIYDNNLLISREKNDERDTVNQLLIQPYSSSPQDLGSDSVPKRKTRDGMGQVSSRLEQQGTRSERPHSLSSKRRRTTSLKAGSKVILKTSTYPNKRNVAYATIRSTDPTTKAGGIELGAEFALVGIDETIQNNEELVREVSDCKTLGDAFSSGLLIAWPSAFIRKMDA